MLLCGINADETETGDMGARTATPAEAIAAIAARMRAGGETRVCVPGGAAEALGLVQAWKDTPDRARGLDFTGLLAPGINRTDYSALGPEATFETVILSPDWRAGFEAGRIRHLPMHYSAAHRRLLTSPLAAAIFHVSAPDAAGACSFGLAGDVAPGLLKRNDFLRVGLINHAMPFVCGAPHIAPDQFDIIVEGDWALLETKSIAAAHADAIAHHVAALVPDETTLQIGIGKLPSAILAALTDRRKLKIYSGLITESLLPLLDSAALADERGAITTGLVLGESAFFNRMAQDDRLAIAPVSVTHDFGAISRIERFVSINAALEVDLFGQVNAEFAKGRQIAGVGGMADFVRGASHSSGGCAIIALQAQGNDGTSRIVAQLPGPCVTLARTDAPIIVTQHGVADLRGVDVNTRAQRLIAIAAPDARDTLSRTWRDLRSRL